MWGEKTYRCGAERADRGMQAVHQPHITVSVCCSGWRFSFTDMSWPCTHQQEQESFHWPQECHLTDSLQLTLADAFITFYTIVWKSVPHKYSWCKDLTACVLCKCSCSPFESVWCDCINRLWTEPVRMTLQDSRYIWFMSPSCTLEKPQLRLDVLAININSRPDMFGMTRAPQKKCRI